MPKKERLVPAPWDIETRKKLDDSDLGSLVPKDAINVYILAIRQYLTEHGYVTEHHWLTYRTLEQFDDKIFNGKPEIGITQTRIDKQLAERLHSAGVPIRQCKNDAEATIFVMENLRSGLSD